MQCGTSIRYYAQLINKRLDKKIDLATVRLDDMYKFVVDHSEMLSFSEQVSARPAIQTFCKIVANARCT